MRDSQFQTPHKDQITANRRSKTTPDLSKKHRKSLNPAFAAISEEKVSDFATEFSSPISAVSVDTPVSESSENSVVNPVDFVLMSTSETMGLSDQAPSSSSPKSMITSDDDEHATSVTSAPKCENPELDSTRNMLPMEAEIVIKHLTTARTHVSKSEIEYTSRELVDALLETIIKELHGGQYKERGLVDELLTSRVNLVILSFMLGVFAVYVSWLLTFGENGHPTRPTPT